MATLSLEAICLSVRRRASGPCLVFAWIGKYARLNPDLTFSNHESTLLRRTLRTVNRAVRAAGGRE